MKARVVRSFTDKYSMNSIAAGTEIEISQERFSELTAGPRGVFVEELKEELKEEPKEEPKEELKEELKEEPKEELKEKLKEELSVEMNNVKKTSDIPKKKSTTGKKYQSNNFIKK